MLKILRQDATGETELTGTRSELLALGHRLRGGAGEMPAVTGVDPSPYDRALPRIAFRLADGKAVIAPSEDGTALVVRGGTESLALLAANIEGFAGDADLDDHLHVDWFPDHDCLAEGSDPLVVGLAAEAAR